MIASVRGTVLTVRLDAAVIEVGGVGMLVHATPTTLAGLRPGAAAQLATSLVVREDSLTLFGFADDDEREVFEVVQTVSGVGPRLALAMLAVHSPDGLRRAVAGEDLAALKRVPGIGHKRHRVAQIAVDRLNDHEGRIQSDPNRESEAERRRRMGVAMIGPGVCVRRMVVFGFQHIGAREKNRSSEHSWHLQANTITRRLKMVCTLNASPPSASSVGHGTNVVCASQGAAKEMNRISYQAN